MIAFAIGIVRLIRAWFVRWTTEVIATDRRVLLVQGFISRHTVEMNASRIESVDVDQTVLGRFLDYGNVTIRGTGTTVEPIRAVDRPLVFRNSITAS